MHIQFFSEITYLILSVEWVLLVFGIYHTIIIVISCTGFGNWFYAAPKPFLNSLKFQSFFFLFFFLGWKLEGCRLLLQSQNQHKCFQMPSGSHILASCHILYDISIFTALSEWERQEEKTKKNRCNFSTAAMSSSYLWLRHISWCDGIHADRFQQLCLSLLWCYKETNVIRG